PSCRSGPRAGRAGSLVRARVQSTVMRLPGLVLSMLLVPAPAVPAADWARFRGPNGSGVAESPGLPSEIGPGKNVVWKAALPAGHSSPVLYGDRIFLTAAEGDKLLPLGLRR